MPEGVSSPGGSGSACLSSRFPHPGSRLWGRCTRIRCSAPGRRPLPAMESGSNTGAHGLHPVAPRPPLGLGLVCLVAFSGNPVKSAALSGSMPTCGLRLSVQDGATPPGCSPAPWAPPPGARLALPPPSPQAPLTQPLSAVSGRQLQPEDPDADPEEDHSVREAPGMPSTPLPWACRARG